MFGNVKKKVVDEVKGVITDEAYKSILYFIGGVSCALKLYSMLSTPKKVDTVKEVTIIYNYYITKGDK